jgi:hypothetical protein
VVRFGLRMTGHTKHPTPRNTRTQAARLPGAWGTRARKPGQFTEPHRSDSDARLEASKESVIACMPLRCLVMSADMRPSSARNRG